MLVRARPLSSQIPSLARHYASAKPESDFLHKSILPSYHFQQCLPRLPVPKLEDTMKRYIVSLEALEGHPEISSDAIEGTKRTVYNFMKNEGPQLHQELLDYDTANPHTSYVSKPWFDMYFESRLPLPLNFNPFMVLNRDPKEAMNDQVLRCTNLIVSSMRFFKTLRSEILEPEVYFVKNTAKSPVIQQVVKYLPNKFNLRYIPMYLNGAYPLDMSQYGNLFSSTRIPREGKDILQTYPTSRHLIILRNGHFYTFNVLDLEGNILPAEEIMNNLQHILNDKVTPPKHPVSYLSTDNRDTWAKARQHLLNTGNISQLTAIDSAIFCLVLEDESVDTNDVEKVTRSFLYGDGARRWFDKSFSLIATKNGEVAMNFEHSWGDGVAVVRYVNEIFDDSIKNPRLTSKSGLDSGSVGNVNRLEFNLDDTSKSNIEKAKERYLEETGRLEMAAEKYEKMNKGYLKEKKVSPDGILQLGIQIAHRRLYGHPAATYESCSTAGFKHGRTETVRSCTVQAQVVAKHIAEKGLGDHKSMAELNHLVRESCKKHNTLTYEAVSGQGFDRHLFGLKHIAQLAGAELPPIFADPSYRVMNHIILSTSTLDTHSLGLGGFGPVVQDGFGIGYGARKDHMGCNVTSYRGKQDVERFVGAVIESFDNIKTILESN